MDWSIHRWGQMVTSDEKEIRESLDLRVASLSQPYKAAVLFHRGKPDTEASYMAHVFSQSGCVCFLTLHFNFNNNFQRELLLSESHGTLNTSR